MPLLFFFLLDASVDKTSFQKKKPLFRCLSRIDVTCALNHHRMQHGNKPEKKMEPVSN